MIFKDVEATIAIDLKKNLDELWNSVDKKARWGVKKAESSGLVFQELKSDEEFNELHQIFKETAKYGGFEESAWDGIKLKNPIYFIVKKDGKIIAGSGVWKKAEDRLRLCMNCSLHDFLEFQPNNLLYWEMIKYAKNNNFNIFDLGGYQLNAAPEDKLYHVNRFKERWGGKIETDYFYSNNPIKIIGRKLVRNFKFAKKLNNAIRNRKN